MQTIRSFISPVELAMKHELGVLGGEDPFEMRSTKLVRRYSEIWGNKK